MKASSEQLSAFIRELAEWRQKERDLAALLDAPSAEFHESIRRFRQEVDRSTAQLKAFGMSHALTSPFEDPDLVRRYQDALKLYRFAGLAPQIEPPASRPAAPPALGAPRELPAETPPAVTEPPHGVQAAIAGLQGSMAQREAEIARLQTEFAAFTSAQQALRPALQRNQQDTTTKKLRKRQTFVQQVDAEDTKSDETGFTDAIVRVLKRTGVKVTLKGARKKTYAIDWSAFRVSPALLAYLNEGVPRAA